MLKVKIILKLLLLKLKNPIIFMGLVFILWMFFFDSNSFINHRSLSKKIEQLKKDQSHYLEQINSDSINLENLSNKEGLEKYAREKYHMKKENEEIFLIED